MSNLVTQWRALNKRHNEINRWYGQVYGGPDVDEEDFAKKDTETALTNQHSGKGSQVTRGGALANKIKPLATRRIANGISKVLDCIYDRLFH